MKEACGKGKKWTREKQKPFTVSRDKKSGAYYCYNRKYPNIPVFGSVGDKQKALEVCRIYNQSIGYLKGADDERNEDRKV